MANLSSKSVQDIKFLYEGIYSQVLTEEQQNEILMIEWYNSLVEEGYIKGDKIEENYGHDQEILNEIWNLIAKYGPKAMNVLRKTTGFGLGQTTGGKRRIITTGAGTATALDPQRAAEIIGGTVSGAARVAQGALQGGIEAGTRAPNPAPPPPPQPPSPPTAYIDPGTGTIKYRSPK